MIASNKFNVFLCLAVLVFTAFPEEKPFLSDHDSGIQAVASQCHGNTNDDLDICLFKPAKKTSHEYHQKQYSFHNSNQKYFNHLRKSARAPPLV